MCDIMYKEVTLYPECSDHWKEITINAGASQSTLQDIKLPETSGCFTYRGSGFLSGGTSNRFIYWRSSNDILELVEISLDINLRDNHLRLRFQHSPILQGLSIHETADHVIILVPTISAIHKLIFSHPKSLQGRDHFLQQSNITYPSIFFETTLDKLKTHSANFILNPASGSQPLPHTSCSWLTSEGDASFVLDNNAGSHLMVTMEVKEGGKISTLELKRTSVVSRLWSGLVRSNQGGDIALSLACHDIVSDVHVFSLCRDLRIRMWSQKKQECLMIASILEYFGEALASFITNSSTQQCWLRASTQQSDFFLGVYLCLPQFNQFLIFQPLCINDQYRLSHVVTLMDSKNDLVDFCVSPPNVWGLWLNSESVPIVKVASFDSDESNTNIGWSSVSLEPRVPSNIFIVYGECDPRDAYIKEILKPGRFSISTILKVLHIYHKTSNPNFIPSAILEPETIRDEVFKIVDNDVFMRGKESELTDEEYQELKIECWDKFFSYCIQYHEVGTKPLGLSFDPVTGYAVVIKKNVYSLLCPSGPLEHLMKSEEVTLGSISTTDPALKTNVIHVLTCLNMIKSFFNESLVNGFEHEMLQYQTPDLLGVEIAKELIQLPSDPEGCLLMKLQSQLQMVTDPISALKYLLREVDIRQKAEAFDLAGEPISGFAECQHFLRSTTGISLLCESFTLFAKQHYEFCRDLLLLELLIIQLGERAVIPLEITGSIDSELLPSTKSLVYGYYTLKWMSETEYTSKPPAQLEFGLQQLSILEASENITLPRTISKTSRRNLVYYYLEEQGRKDAYSILSGQISFEEFTQKPWAEFLPQLVSNIAILLWPQGPYFQFPEFLLNHSQCEQFQEYNKLLRTWCDFNICSRQFLDANCFLVFEQYEDAVKLFVKAGEGIDRESFLKSKIIPQVFRVDSQHTTSSVAMYYMKVIELFEQYKLSTHVITLASTVIGILEENDTYLPIFWSIVFKHHLEIGNSQEAYTALTRNPDLSRQKDCLRQMIVVLCERKEFQTLVQFPYLGMQEEVINILETRARSSDLIQQNFYDLLYAFHIHTNNFRKAASISFEHSMRLGQEINTYDGLQKQSACLLATINCLHLVDPVYAWIVKPVPKFLEEEECQNMSPKRDNDGQQIPSLSLMKKKVEVLEIKNIRHEYDLIRARMLLVQKDDNTLAVTPLSPADCVTLLINAGFFDVAIELSEAFSLPLTPIFEGLTYRCVTMMHQPSVHCIKDDDEVYDWIGQNDSSNLPVLGYISAKDQVWYLLKNYLIKYEKKGETILHHSIAHKLLSLGVHLPVWLKHSYQAKNSSQLLWLYIKYGDLEAATDLAIDLIDVALGYDKESLGINHQLRATNPPVWLPHSYFDALCDALEDIQNEPNCTKLYQELTKKLEEYVRVVKQVSNDIIVAHRN